jgi:hypothetical protein
MKKIRSRLTFANVISCLALFVALGGSAYAVSHLGKNSVGSKQLKKNAVITAKIKNEAVTGAKVKKGTLTGMQINASTLGTVPGAEAAQVAQTAKALTPPEAWHLVGAQGEPIFFGTWTNSAESTAESVGFFKDHEGIVHLRGKAIGGGGENLFALPPGFRPASGKFVGGFQVGCSGTLSCSDGTGEVAISGSGFGVTAGSVSVPPGATTFTLNGISFRAES